MLVPLSVADCMTADVETIAADATAREAAAALAAVDLRTLVVREGDRPVGIVTESDVTRLVADGADLDSAPVASFAAGDLVTVGPTDAPERAAELCAEHGIRQLPVVEDGALVGIVTTSDLSDYLPRLSKRRQRADAATDGALPAANPEMAYDHPAWAFESHGTEDGVGVGDVVRFSKEFSEVDVRGFAESSGDTNRLHLDGTFAADTRFGGRIVHGVLATGLISAALARLPGLTIYLSQDLRFMRPVRIGEPATAVCRVCEDMGGDRYRLDVTVYDGDGERAIDGEAVVLMDDLPERFEESESSDVPDRRGQEGPDASGSSESSEVPEPSEIS